MHYFSQSLNTRETHGNCDCLIFWKSMTSSCQSQMVCSVQASWDICESHRSVTVQRMVSGMKFEQACNLFTQVQKAWEGHIVRSASEYYYIVADTFAMISYDKFLVKRSRATLCGCNELGKLEKRYLLCC